MPWAPVFPSVLRFPRAFCGYAPFDLLTTVCGAQKVTKCFPIAIHVEINKYVWYHIAVEIGKYEIMESDTMTPRPHAPTASHPGTTSFPQFGIIITYFTLDEEEGLAGLSREGN